MLFAFSAVSGKFTYAVARGMALHLLRTNPQQAQAMCGADKGTFLEAINAVFKTAVMVKTRDPAILAQASRASYDAQCMQIHMHWKAVFKRLKTAGLLAVGGVALAIGIGASPLVHILLAAVTLVGGVAVLRYKLDVERSLVLARAEVLPEVERAIVDGRYALPP